MRSTISPLFNACLTDFLADHVKFIIISSSLPLIGAIYVIESSTIKPASIAHLIWNELSIKLN